MQADAATVAALLAVDPQGLGGVCLRSPAGDARDIWLALLKSLLPQATALRRVPVNISDAALLGGLDLAATLQARRPIALRGLLPSSDGGLLLLAMAERMSSETAARFCAVLDTGAVALQRDGLDATCDARVALVAMDEGISDDEALPAALRERLAFWVVSDDQGGLDSQDGDDGRGEPEADLNWTAEEVLAARGLLARVAVDEAVVQTLCAAAMALGIDSLRAPSLALRAARAAAALAGAETVYEDHVALAARLVLAPRATRVPPVPPSDETPPPQEVPQEQEPPEDDPAPTPDEADVPQDEQDSQEPEATQDGEMQERVLESVLAALPAGLLASLALGSAPRVRIQNSGRAGAAQKSQLRGRPIGARAGEPRAGQRLNVLETLRAAAPWQKLRQPAHPGLQNEARIQVRKQDFHVTRYRQRSQTTTIFVVDASGSAALNRLAEAKGAVELLLADCYVRRDRVAVVAFRGKAAEILLAPTRSLARAKRSLSGLPGGGGTPLASGIDAAREMGEQVRRKGETPLIVLLTDGRGNIARDGSPGRAAAAADMLDAARQLRLSGLTTLLLDNAAQPQPAAQALAAEMGARYLPLPYASAQAMSRAVKAVSGFSNQPP